jgi:hypothetical protein
MKSRERLLLVIFLLTLVIWQGRAFVARFLLAPLADREAELSRLDAQLAELQKRDLQVLQAMRRLNQWKQQSLPADPFDAQRLYQKWLSDLGHRAGLSELTVTPEQHIANEAAYVAVQVAVEGRAELRELITFLYEFYRAPLLQCLVQLSLVGDEEGRDPMLKFTLLAEGLALPNVPPRKQLFPYTERSEALPLSVHPAIAHRPLSDYLRLSPTKLFLRPKPAMAGVKRTPPPPRDAAKDTYLIASILQEHQREAWLYNSFKKQKSIVVEGQSFSAGDVTLLVLRIDGDGLVVERDGSHWRLAVGENLRSLVPWEQAGELADV